VPEVAVWTDGGRMRQQANFLGEDVS